MCARNTMLNVYFDRMFSYSQCTAAGECASVRNLTTFVANLLFDTWIQFAAANPFYRYTLANSQRNTPAPRREPCSPLRVKCAHYGTERQAEQAKQAQSADCGCPRWRTGMAQLRPRPRRGAPEGQGAAAAPCPDFSSPLLSPFRRGVLPSPPSASSSPGTCGGGR